MALGCFWWRAGVPVWRRCRGGCLCGRAFMGLGWLWWRAWVPVGAIVAAAVCVAGVALGDIDLHFAWQLGDMTFTLRGRRGTSLCVVGVALMALGWLWWRGWFPFAAVVTVAVCVAGVALGDIDLHFARQLWYLVTSTFTLRGRCGTYGTSLGLWWLLSLCHTQLSHSFVTHTQLCHIHLFHTQSFTHNFVTYNSFTHNTFTYTNLHTHTLAQKHLCEF